jgi:hypothetical protein
VGHGATLAGDAVNMVEADVRRYRTV